MANQGNPNNLESNTIGIPPPKLQNLTSVTASAGVSSLWPTDYHVWEIGVPKKKSLSWSIVLSYLLMPCTEHDLQRRLQKLTGSDSYAKKVKEQKNMSPDKIKSKDVRKSLLNFNPFKNRHVSFFNHKLKEVMRIFDIKLKRFAGNLLRTNGDWNDSLKLQAASNMLNCSIDVFYPKDGGYLRFDPSGNRSAVRITLFQYENIQLQNRSNAINIFHFGLDIEQAAHLQVEALVFILRKAKIPEYEIIEIQRTLNIDKFIIFSLLNSSKIYIIPELYKSPYHVLKLADAGFESDPTAKDPNGLSMLCYAMTHLNTMFLKSLYNFSANSCQLSETCIRNPDESITESLNNLSKVIDEDRKKVLNLCNIRCRKETYLQTSLEYLRFCEYQTKIAEDIIAVRGPNPNHSGSFELRKNIILTILDYYTKFYYYNCNASNDFDERYWDFVRFNEYYLSLDNFTCLLFFDHAFCFETEIPTNLSDCFRQLEEAFFLLVISSVFFQKHKHQLHCNGCILNFSECEKRNNTMLLIPFLFRSSLQLYVTDFMRKLRASDANPVLSSAGAVSDSGGAISVPSCAGVVPAQSVATPVRSHSIRSTRRNILSIPEIKDELLISRVKGYTKAAIQISLDEHKLKGIPVIERALQVIGESLKPSSTEKCIASHLLCSSMSSNLQSSFVKIRNSFLSHYRAYSVPGRQEVEQNVRIFELIQDELRSIDETFEIVYTLQDLRVEQFLIKQGIEVSKKWSLQNELVSKINKEYSNTISLKRSKLINSKRKFYILSKQFVDYIGSHVNSSQLRVADIRSMFWTLEYLLNLISQQCNDNQATTLRNITQDFNNYLNLVIASNLTDDYKRDIAAILEACHSNLDSIFGIISSSSNTVINCSQIEKLLDSVTNVYHFTEDEKVIIRGLVANDEAIAAKQELEKIQYGAESRTPDEEEILFRKLNIPEEDLDKLKKNFRKDKRKSLMILKKVRNLSEPVEGMLTDNILEKKDYWDMIKRLKLPDALKIRLFHVVNQKLEYLLNRIDLLKNILIDEDDEIRQMWKYGKNDGIKKHSKFLMGQRYRKELDFRAALEMLLFDCLNILLSRNDLTELWTKTNSLCAGMNLRNALSHGHDVLQMIGGFLDPQDLPMELITKILELIEDSTAIKAMFTLCKEEDAEYIKDIRDKLSQKCEITRCSRWQKYLSLMYLK